MLNLFEQTRLKTDDFNQEIEFLIEGFIPRRMITLFYASGGSGKSWLAYAAAKYSALVGMQVIYIDYDNPISILTDRSLDKKLIAPYSNLFYMSSSKVDESPEEMIRYLSDISTDHSLDKMIFFIDSLRDFCDVKNDNQSRQVMSVFKQLREAGATVIILSHSNKDARNYEGSNNIYNSADNMYRVTKIEEDRDRGHLKYLFTPQKARASTGECAWALDANTLDLTPMDVAEAKLSTEDKDFIEGVKAVLAKTPGLNKKELLDKLGYDKRDKTANNRLDRYTGQHWVSAKKSNVYTYQLKV